MYGLEIFSHSFYLAYKRYILIYIYRLLTDKKKELGDQANKLRNGLSKIDETREKVKNMTIELEDAKVKVVQFQKQCDDYLVVIVQQKRDADEQQKVSTIVVISMQRILGIMHQPLSPLPHHWLMPQELSLTADKSCLHTLFTNITGR